MRTRKTSKKWPRILPRGTSWRVDCGVVFGVQRRYKQFPTLAEAEQYAEDMRAERNAMKNVERFERRNRSVSLSKLTDSQRAEVLRAFDMLTGKGSLISAVQFYLKHAAPAQGQKTVQEVFTAYMEAKAKANRRPRTIQDARSKLYRFVEQHENSGIHAISTDDLDRWLDAQKFQDASRVAYIRHFLAFFNFAQKKRHCEGNPALALEKPALDERMPEIHTVAQMRAILTTAQQIAPEMLPYFAIGYFAGLRPENELAGLDWRDIDFENGKILVRPETAKKRRSRYVDMSANLIEWLMPHRQPEGKIFFSRRYYRQIREAAHVEWAKDVMRHSFASYHVAQHEDAAATSLQLGHAGKSDVLFAHYRNLVKRKEAEAYWKITPPPTDSSVVQFPTAAVA